MASKTTSKIRAIPFILCAVWLSTTVSFFAMVTSDGGADMELELGTLLSLQGSSATLFVRGMLGFGLIMLVLFIWRRRPGFVLAVLWSVGWAIILGSAVFTPMDWSERINIFVVVACFAASAWLALVRLKKSIQ